ncbi:MAG: glycosyltransferase family 39 protein [bacterium]|nr:glycosyltransferase family 39 protein [bacterium]
MPKRIRKRKVGKSDRGKSTERVASRPIAKDLVLILAIGTAVRVIYNLSLPDSPFFGMYFLDSQVLNSSAKDILSGSTSDLAYFRAPLYPYLLALVYKLFGVTPWAVIIFQNLLGLSTAIVVYRFAEELFSRVVALWSGIICSVYPTLVFFEGETMITSLAVFLYTASVYGMWKASESDSVARTLGAGVIMGLAAITRPTIIPLALIFPVVLLYRHGWSQVLAVTKRSIVFGGAILIPVLPVTFRNVLIGGEPVLISTQGGVNFYIGNNEDADGLTVVSPGPQLRIGKYQDNIWTSSMDEANHRAGRELTQSEVSSFWTGEALKWISSNPSRFSTLYLKKLWLFWHGQEVFNNKSLYYAAEYSWYMKTLLWQNWLNFPSGVVLPFMFTGIIVSLFRDRKALLPCLYLLSSGFLMSLFFVCSRFRQPLMPIAIMMSVYGAIIMVRYFREKRSRGVLIAATTLVFTIGLNSGGNIESRINRSQFLAILGGIYEQKNQPDHAISQYKQALELMPDNMQVYGFLANALFNKNEYARANEVYSTALSYFPDYPPFTFGLARSFQSMGEVDSAKFRYSQTIDNAPNFGAAMDRLGYIYRQEGRIDSAVVYYRMLLGLSPGDKRLRELVAHLDSAVTQELNE